MERKPHRFQSRSLKVGNQQNREETTTMKTRTSKLPKPARPTVQIADIPPRKNPRGGDATPVVNRADAGGKGERHLVSGGFQEHSSELELDRVVVRDENAGRLPHGMGVARLADMPAEWSRQHQLLGLPSA